MQKSLHITNGDGAAAVIEASSVEGDVLPWRDPMHHGPFPSTLTFDELSRVRISYLSGDDIALQNALQVRGGTSCDTHGFSERDATLLASAEYDEVVLWFEHDLLDQLQLLQLLDWFNQPDFKAMVLSVICIDRFDGVDNFRGIGQLSSEQMASLYPGRKQVTPRRLEMAKQCWAAFRRSSPEDLLTLCLSFNKDPSALPFMANALFRHCQEFPWTSDGLTRTERQLLTLINSGVDAPGKVFVENMEFETCLYIGDWRTYTQLAELCAADKPLLACSDGSAFKHPHGANISMEEFQKQQLVLTEYGRAVLDGQINSHDTMRRDSWLGGVHLNSEQSIWYWNNASCEFQFS